MPKKIPFKNMIEKIKGDKKVIAVFLFGSYTRKKSYARDIDICIMLDKNYTNYELSKKRLKFLTQVNNKFDVQIFQQLPLYIRKTILKEGKILYSKDIKKIYDTAYATIKEYEDFEPRYKGYIEAVRT